MRVDHRSAAVSVVALLVTMAAVAVAAQAQFPNTRSRGRATVEFNDRQVRVVASYNYSQREHDSAWLLIQLAVSSNKPRIIEPTGISLRAPDGQVIPLATQRRFGEEMAAIKVLLQNSVTSWHETTAYFSQRDRVESLRLFRLPFGDVVHSNFVVDNDRVAAGEIFFESPTGSWPAGVYTLVIAHESGEAALPIRLE